MKKKNLLATERGRELIRNLMIIHKLSIKEVWERNFTFPEIKEALRKEVDLTLDHYLKSKFKKVGGRFLEALGKVESVADEDIKNFVGKIQNGIIPLLIDNIELFDNKIAYVEKTGEMVFNEVFDFLKMLNRSYDSNNLNLDQLTALSAMITEPIKVDIVEKDDVVWFYKNANIKSCMAKRSEAVLELLGSKCFSIAIATINNVVVGRALIAKTTKGVKFVHKMYDNVTHETQASILRVALNKFVEDNGYVRSGIYEIEVDKPLNEYDGLPYMDIFKHVSDPYEKFLNNYCDGDYVLNRTDGSSIDDMSLECSSCGCRLDSDDVYYITYGSYEGESRCGDCCVVITVGRGDGEIVDEDDAYYSEYEDGYVIR